MLVDDDLKSSRRLHARGVLYTSCIVLTLAGCATTSPYQGEDVAVAAEQGSLESMYLDVDRALQRARPDSDKYASLMLVRNDLAHRLSVEHLARIDDLLASSATAALSLPELAELDAEIAIIEPWQPLRAEGYAAQALVLRNATEQEVADLLGTLDTLAPSQVGQRYIASMRLADLEGGERGEQRRLHAQSELETTYDQGMMALQEYQLARALALFDEVVDADSGYGEALEHRQMAARGLFEQEFWRALVDGQADDAYASLYRFVQSSAFEDGGRQVALDAIDLAQHYEALGDKARRKGKWLDSYRAFQRAAFIRTRLQLPFSPSPGLTAFLNEMERRYRAAVRAGQQAEAFAYLSVIESSFPQHALLGDNKLARHSALIEQASISVSVDRFGGAYGGDLSAMLRDLLEDGSAERPFRLVGEASQPPPGAPQSLTYVLRGEARPATVRRQSSERTESKSVRVGTATGPNPEYAAWKKLPKSERDKAAEPDKEAALPVYEYVGITYTDVTSLAQFSAEFQLLDTVSGAVALAEAVTATAVVEGIEIAPLTRGEFSQAAVAADIPADGDQTLALAKEVATSINAQLLVWLSALDSYYADRASALDADQQSSAAVEAWVLAYAISEPGSDRHAELRTLMEEAVLGL